MLLQKRFYRLLSPYLSQENLEQFWVILAAKYNSPSRHYHNLVHLEKMFEHYDYIKSSLTNCDSVAIAIFYHDIIYSARKTNNEAQSAAMMEAHLSKSTYPEIEKVKALILATKEHKRSSDSDTNIFLDIDMSILGAAPQKYLAYSKAVRKEFRIYPNFLYLPGRIKVLKSFLAAEAIFKTEYFFERFEVAARRNILAEIERLERK